MHIIFISLSILKGFFYAKKMKKIAIQGIQGAFHEVAAQKHFGKDIQVVECLSFKELCEALQHEKVDYAIMAIENTIAGSLLPNYALIREYKFKIIGEVFLNIKMNLMTLKNVNLDEISVVESHPIALQQCKEYIYENMPNAKMRESNDTAESAKDLRDSNDTHKAIIAAERCSELYDLDILEKGIETNKHNFTRFLILNKDGITSNENNKASLSLQLGHEVGSLATILTIFKTHHVNLTKIQSVPIIGSPYEYHFHIDIEWKDNQEYESALNEIIKKVSSFSLLGEYKKAKYSLNN